MKIFVCLLLFSAIFSLKSNLRLLQNNLNSQNTSNASSSNETSNNIVVNATELTPEPSNATNNGNNTSSSNNTEEANNNTKTTISANITAPPVTNTTTPSPVTTSVVSSIVPPNPQEQLSVMSCVGNAATNLDSNRIRIEFKVETLNATATSALEENSNISRKMINSLKNQGINESSEIQTTSFSVAPKYDSIYNDTTKTYDTVFKGYTVSNVIVLTTIKKEQAGALIDVGVKAGASVNSVGFEVSEGVANKARMDLIKNAIEDCNKQIKSVLYEIGYRVIGYKSIKINDFEGLTPINIPQAAFGRTQENNNIKLFAGKIPVMTKVNIEVTISK
jgi:uncharacterized protein YggE